MTTPRNSGQQLQKKISIMSARTQVFLESNLVGGLGNTCVTALLKSLWFAQSEMEAIRVFGYADLVTDHLEKFERAYAEGEDPKTFTTEVGDDLNLTRTSEINFGKDNFS
jgi:hypothetical protein